MAGRMFCPVFLGEPVRVKQFSWVVVPVLVTISCCLLARPVVGEQFALAVSVIKEAAARGGLSIN